MKAALAVLLAAVCFGTTGTARALLDVDATAASIGLARVAIGGGLIALIAGLAHRRHTVRGESAQASGLLSRLPTGVVVVAGAAGVLAYQPAFFAGTAGNGVAVGTVVALGSAPVVTGVLDAALRHRRPSRRWYAATGLAVVGVTLISGLAGGGGRAVDVSVVWSIAAGASYALYAVAAKELLDRGWGAADTVGAVFGVAAAVALPLLALTAPTWLATGEGLGLALWLGVLTTTVAYLLFGYGLARLPATTAASLTLAEPLCAALLGVGLLGERLTPVAAIGIVVLALGLAVLATPLRRPRRRRTERADAAASL